MLGVGAIEDICQFRDKIKQVIKLAIGEGFYRPSNEFLIDAALTFPDTINLTYRDSHSLG